MNTIAHPEICTQCATPLVRAVESGLCADCEDKQSQIKKEVEEAFADFGRTPLINREHCRKFLLQYARDKRAHKFTRVSEQTLVDANAMLSSWLRQRVNALPSKGQTI